MKKILIALVAIVGTAMTILTGCKSIPSAMTVETTAYSLGIVGGYACELSKTKTEVREGILTVLDIASKVIPATNETFTVAWTPIIDSEVTKLVETKKIGETEATLIKKALSIATGSIDFMFTRHPVWKEYQDFVSAAVTGFVGGFETVVQPSNSTLAMPSESVREIDDIKAYQTYLKSTIK